MGRTAASSAASSGSSIWKYTEGPADPEAIYDHPELYEMAFSYRDVKKEVRAAREKGVRRADVFWGGWGLLRGGYGRMQGRRSVD